MKLKKSFALMLAALMLIGALAGCGNGNNDSSTKNQGDSTTPEQEASEQEIETIVFAFPATKIVDGIQMVEDEVNKITEEKINVHVKFEAISMASYTENVGLMMSSGEQADVVTCFVNYNQMLSKNQLMCLNDYIDEYASGLKEAVGEEFLKTMSKNGDLYGVPTLNGKAAVLNIVIREDILEEHNISVDGLKLAKNFEEYLENLDELTKIFAQLKEAEPDMVQLVPGIQGDMMFANLMPFF